MPGFYDYDGNPIELTEWAELMEARALDFVRWRVGHEQIGDVAVSTIWLGLDHNYFGQGPPLIFETMIFGGDLDGEMWRYSTAEQAEQGHARAVEQVRLAQAIKAPQ